MSNISTNPLLFSNPYSDASVEYLAKMLLGEHEFYSEREDVFLARIELLRGFAIAKGLDSQNMISAITPHYTKLIPTIIEHVFSRLEILGHDAEVSVYVGEYEANLFLWSCKEADGYSDVNFREVYLPYDLINDLGENYYPSYSGLTTYGKSIETVNIIRFYNSHRHEVIEANISAYLEELKLLFDYFVSYVKKGLTNKKIIEALDAADFEPLDNEVDYITPTISPI